MTVRPINELLDEKLTPELVFGIHRQGSWDTLDNPDAAGRFRRTGEDVRVEDEFDQVFHYPPMRRSSGATFISEAEDAFWGGYSGSFQDPDGHIWEVVWNPELQDL